MQGKPDKSKRDAGDKTAATAPLQFPANLTWGETLDGICDLVSHATGASMVLIAMRENAKAPMKVVGRAGTLVTEVDLRFVMDVLDPGIAPVLLSPDVRSDPRFHADDLLNLMPHIKSVIAMLVPPSDMQGPTVLFAANPRKAAMQDGTTMQVLTDLGNIIRNVMQLRLIRARELEQLRGSGPAGNYLVDDEHRFAGLEESNSAVGDAHAAANFLFETLIPRRGLHSRNGADYVSLRAWRQQIKKYQIAALIANKEAPSATFVARIAEELAAYARQAHGARVIKTVVPVPPGSSGKQVSLSTLLAEQVAKLLEAKYSDVLVSGSQVTRGKSTPRKSSQLTGYSLSQPVEGPVLIIDDVVTSGRHIELAMKACKLPTTAVYALAWIGK